MRAVVLDEQDRILLVRHDLRTAGAAVWAAPGGGVEARETLLSALRRELAEEIGLSLTGAAPPHVWHQVIDKFAVVNEYFLVRTEAFEPRPGLSPEALAAEQIGRFRWWTVDEIECDDGRDVFSPRNLAGPLAVLLVDGVPTAPVGLGL